jgi:hypothetical protein
MNRPRNPVALLLVLALCPPVALGAEPATTLDGWWGGMDVGYASTARTYSATGDTTQQKMMTSLRLGYAWDPRLLLGLEFENWLLKGANVAHLNEGEGIQTYSLIAQYYPFGSPLYFKAGAGIAKFWNENPGETGASGSGAVVGLGYDVRISGSIHYTPAIDLAWGHINGATSPPGVTQDQRYRAVAVKIGLTFR